MNLFRNKKILIIGDVMIDSYLFGNVERISPEAPVPIVDIKNKQNKLGGAANVATNIKNLGGTPIICTIIGKDDNSAIFLSLLKNAGITNSYIHQTRNRITTSKTRIIGNNHQMLRVDEELKTELLLDDQHNFLYLIDDIFNYEKIDCVIFEDYDKGVLNKDIITTVINKAQKLNIPIIVDPKKKNFSYYNNVTLFKPNLKEFKESIGSSLEEGSKILHDNGIEIVFVTLSENGIFISYKKDNKIINKIIPGIPRDVVDVSGAGDTVISVVSMLIYDIDVEDIANISNIAGGLVCEEVGVVPIDMKKLLKEYDKTKY